MSKKRSVNEVKSVIPEETNPPQDPFDRRVVISVGGHTAVLGVDRDTGRPLAEIVVSRGEGKANMIPLYFTVEQLLAFRELADSCIKTMVVVTPIKTKE